jgi:hypothetical protein
MRRNKRASFAASSHKKIHGSETMKRLFVLALLALTGVFATGRITLGESGANRYLMTMSKLTDEGKSDEVCAMFHDELQFHVVDRTGPSTKDLDGGKAELCALVQASIAALSRVPHDKETSITKLAVTREWLHPWTSRVTYTEDQDIAIRGANVTLKTTSDDKITLVQTLTGVKLLKLDAEVWQAE